MLGASPQVPPNPSLNRSTNGGPPGPVWRYAVRGTFSPVRAWRPAAGARLARTLVPSYSALCRPALIPALHLSPRFLLGSFGALLGFACVRLVGFKPFGPLALVQKALPAIVLAALRRFRGPALFRGPRPSSRLGAPFWPSGLTLRSSGPAFCGPLTLAVMRLKRHDPFKTERVNE